jgi:AmpE protein
MTLIALFLGLIIERAATQLLRLREPRWFDAYLQWTLGRFRDLRGASLMVVTCLLVLLPVLPVALVAALFHDILLGVAYVAFATVVLTFSFGPRDLHDEVDDYLSALEANDRERAARVAREIMEHDAAQRTRGSAESLEDAIFVQTNNRTFGVAFWFMLAGPAGAWAFRVSDLMRRRAVFEYRGRATDPAEVPEFVHALQVIHGVLAWAPARFLALGYAFAGAFERAMSEWRRYAGRAGAHFFDVNDQMLASVGRGALEAPVAATGVLPLPDTDRVRSCMAVVNRALLIWLVFVSALVLVGWIR